MSCVRPGTLAYKYVTKDNLPCGDTLSCLPGCGSVYAALDEQSSEMGGDPLAQAQNGKYVSFGKSQCAL